MGCSFFSLALGTEPRTLYTLSVFSVSEPQPHEYFVNFMFKVNYKDYCSITFQNVFLLCVRFIIRLLLEENGANNSCCIMFCQAEVGSRCRIQDWSFPGPRLFAPLCRWHRIGTTPKNQCQHLIGSSSRWDIP